MSETATTPGLPTPKHLDHVAWRYNGGWAYVTDLSPRHMKLEPMATYFLKDGRVFYQYRTSRLPSTAKWIRNSTPSADEADYKPAKRRKPVSAVACATTP